MSKTVMIVDDSAMVRTSLKNALEAAGFSTIEASDGQEAQEKVSETIDFVICDVNMPRMNGLEFLEQLSNSEGPKPPVMMLTTEAQPELLRDAREFGAVGWMVKPCEPELLVEAVRQMAA